LNVLKYTRNAAQAEKLISCLAMKTTEWTCENLHYAALAAVLYWGQQVLRAVPGERRTASVLAQFEIPQHAARVREQDESVRGPVERVPRVEEVCPRALVVDFDALLEDVVREQEAEKPLGK
jgi:hypothetical protein